MKSIKHETYYQAINNVQTQCMCFMIYEKYCTVLYAKIWNPIYQRRMQKRVQSIYIDIHDQIVWTPGHHLCAN